MLTGCTTETKINKPKTIKEETPVVLTTKGHDVKEAVNKSETITVKTKASGEIKSTKAEVTIPSISEGDLIQDTTILKDISNKGDENITLNNHQLLIENNKNSYFRFSTFCFYSNCFTLIHGFLYIMSFCG